MKTHARVRQNRPIRKKMVKRARMPNKIKIISKKQKSVLKKKSILKKNTVLKKKPDLKKRIVLKKTPSKPKKAEIRSKTKLKLLRFKTPQLKMDTILIEPALDETTTKPILGKILHTPINVAGQMSAQATSLQKLGAPVSFCSYTKQGKFEFPEDLPSPLKGVPPSLHGKAMMNYAMKCANTYDIFHFHWGQSFTRFHYTDLPILKLMGKKIVMSFWGTDVRKASIAKQNNPFARVKLTDENEINRRLDVLSRYVDAAIVPDHELFEYVKGYFKKVFLVRASVDYRKFNPLYPDINNKRPLVVHAPSNRYIKGTELIARVIQSLKQKVDFDYVQVEKASNANVHHWIRKADLLVDQLHLGIYGTVAIEAMLFGKPAISHIRTDLLDKYPAKLPVVPANPHTFEQVFYNLITNPQIRYELGKRGRVYAIEHHDPMKIARQLITVYKSL